MEAIGLTVGLLGLAGLFSQCKDLLDLIETGRSYARGLEALDTKFEAQKLRFQIWGEAVGLVGDLTPDENLAHDDVRPVVQRILNNMRLLFDDTHRLKGTFGPRQINDQNAREGFAQLLLRLRRSQEAASLSTKARWSVSRKDKFQTLVEEIRTFMDSLESITSSLEQLSRRRNLLERNIAAAPDEASLRALREVSSESGIVVSDSASSRFLHLDDFNHDPTDSVPDDYSSSHATYVSCRTHPRESMDMGRGDPASITLAPPEIDRQLTPTGSTDDCFSREEVVLQTEKFKTLWQNTGNIALEVVTAGDDSALSGPFPKRIRKEFESVSRGIRDNNMPMSFMTINGSLVDLLGVFMGPASTPYEGGIFFTRWTFTPGYPFTPPLVKFLTKIYHPNIDPRGVICLDILNDSGSSVSLGLEKTLVSIISILDDPTLDDPFVPQIAEQYQARREEYDRTARAYTMRYATGDLPSFEPHDAASPWWQDAENLRNALDEADLTWSRLLLVPCEPQSGQTTKRLARV
ncbi:hypothetical protein PV08_03353 [Exophiala spinifera]|uniref:UBC core domain-containing protein n=1 Tax=Exophiala spinifera TaxID=91928 RepID=A0A0D2BJJ1_9EURO|nr:uncharacterized protein PV08_03353 [Exophiala spinifera]KIW19063.1 hypothetical protein PV08_03353 [Exophiala spinifera]